MDGNTRRLSAERVIWAFEPGLKPAYTVAPGELVVIETQDALGGQVYEGMESLPEIDRANPATGPIAVTGVHPGHVLAVDILCIEVGHTGYLTFGGQPRFYSQRGGLIEFDASIRLPISPMIGTIGVAPASGFFETKVSGNHGGNMDVRDVAPNTTLYLTAQVENGLLALGDVHAIQADGETSGQGIETAAEITLRVRVLEEGLSPLPYLLRDGHLMVIASAPSLQGAARDCVEAMASIITSHSRLAYAQARTLIGQVADLRVGQIVCATKTMRVSLPLNMIPWSLPLPL